MVITSSEHDYRNIFKLMVGAIVPRPIAFVSTISPNGIRNLAPFSFFTGISAKPLGGSLVIGDVVRFHAIGRMSGPMYTRTTDRFDMVRPKTGEKS
jgi:hypothetical protein